MTKPMDKFLDKAEDWLEAVGADCFGQTCFLFGLVTIAGFGVREAIPGLYGPDSTVAEWLQWLGVFLFAEILMNWACIKCVDSSYKPRKHGTQPENTIQDGDKEECNYDNKDAQQTDKNPTTVRKDATSVPINLNHDTSETEYDNKETKPPYFSWQHCPKCVRPRPPRAHHCVICDQCILKRDHHCFVTGVCIGHNNLRHFTVMLFWSVIATTFGGLHSLAYFWYFILPYTSILDLFLPLAMLRCVVFRVQVKHLVLILMGWLLAGFFLWSIGFFRRVCLCITTGLTSHEQWKEIQLYDSKPLGRKIRAVFGHFWMINFIFPLHLLFKPIEDPVYWPTVSSGHSS